MNELLLIASIFVYFGLLLCCERFFGKAGLYIWTVAASILMNFEVLKLVDAFGITMTLGNVLLASTFLAGDIASEKYGKKEALKLSYAGCVALLIGIFVTQFILAYVPSTQDFTHDSMMVLFNPVPRIAIASFIAFAASRVVDILLYHFIWGKTSQKGNAQALMWLRSGVAMVAGMIINAFVFNFGAWLGVYDIATCMEISIATALITIITAIIDIPFAYFSKRYIAVEKQ